MGATPANLKHVDSLPLCPAKCLTCGCVELAFRALFQVLTGSLAYFKSIHELASVLVSGSHTSWVFWRFDLDQDNCLQASEVEKYVECYFDKALADAPLQHRHLRCTHLAQALMRAHDKNLDRKLSRAEYLALVLDNVIGAQLSLYFWEIFPQQLPKHDELSLRRRLRAFGTLMAQVWKKSTATSENFVKSFKSDDEEVLKLFAADQRRCSRASRRKTWHT